MYRERYKDGKLLAAAGSTKVEPSDKFVKLARSLKIPVPTSKSDAPDAGGSPVASRADMEKAVRESTLAIKALGNAAFNQNSPLYVSSCTFLDLLHLDNSPA